jgi:hypothetical protein
LDQLSRPWESTSAVDWLLWKAVASYKYREFLLINMTLSGPTAVKYNLTIQVQFKFIRNASKKV